jgi:hypothetical protein
MPEHRQRPRYVLAILVAKQWILVAGLDLSSVPRSRTQREGGPFNLVMSPRVILHLLDPTTATRAIKRSLVRHTFATFLTGIRNSLT